MFVIPANAFLCDMCENFFAQRWAIPTITCIVGAYAGIWVAAGYNNYKNRDVLQKNKELDDICTKLRSRNDNLTNINEQLDAKCIDLDHLKSSHEKLEIINKRLTEKNAAFETIRHTYNIILPIPKERNDLPTKEHVEHFKLLGFAHSVRTRDQEKSILLLKKPQE